MQDIAEQEENQRYSHSSSNRGKQQKSRDQNARPFAVRDAPWHQSVSLHLIFYCVSVKDRIC